MTYLWRDHQRSKSCERVVEGLFRDHWIEITNKELGADFYCFLLVGGCFVHPNGFAVEPDLIHDPGGIFCVFLANEFNEPISLVSLRNAIFG